MQYTYKLMLHKEPDGGYTVNVPALPGCITYGEDIEEAIAMAENAIELYIEELQSRNEPIPPAPKHHPYFLSTPENRIFAIE